MLTNCPKCKKVISVEKSGNTFCPKCGTYIFVGDPIKDEENKVLFNTEEELKKEFKSKQFEDVEDNDKEKNKKKRAELKHKINLLHKNLNDS